MYIFMKQHYVQVGSIFVLGNGLNKLSSISVRAYLYSNTRIDAYQLIVAMTGVFPLVFWRMLSCRQYPISACDSVRLPLLMLSEGFVPE